MIPWDCEQEEKMGTFEQINEDLKAAMKEGRKEDVGIYRMVLAEIKNLAIEMNSRDDINDDIVIASLVKAVKTRLASIEQYKAGGRDDLADREEREIEIISRYLPEELGEDELAVMVDEAIAESGARSPKDIGKVMQAVMPRAKGRADGNTVRKLVMERLKGE
jgi:uncharacterized protein YqeY